MRPLLEHLLRFPPLRGTEDPDLEGLVFYTEDETPVRRHVFRRVWHRACGAAGVPPIRLEWLRHTGASLAYAASRDLKAVAARLGHTSTRMVDTRFVELYEEAGRDLAEAIDALARKRRGGTICDGGAGDAGPSRDQQVVGGPPAETARG